MKKILFIVLFIITFFISFSTLLAKEELYAYSLPYINHDSIILSANNIYIKKIISSDIDNKSVNQFEKQPVSYNNYVINTDEIKTNIEDTKDISSTFVDDKQLISAPLIIEDLNSSYNDKETKIVENNDNELLNEETKKEIKKTGYYAPNGNYLGESKVKVIDVSYYQKNINWDDFYNSGAYYGVILRLGFYTTLDKSFERNLSELKRLNIPYGIYLFSYATSINGAKKEATFTNNMIDKYDIKPSLGIYYDLESWKTNNLSTDNITKNGYNYIAKGYIESVKAHVNNNYKVGIYSGRWYAMNRLGNIAKSYVLWVAEYNKTCKYDSSYIMWQYTSKGSVPGINGYVDISYLF